MKQQLKDKFTGIFNRVENEISAFINDAVYADSSELESFKELFSGIDSLEQRINGSGLLSKGLAYSFQEMKDLEKHIGVSEKIAKRLSSLKQKIQSFEVELSIKSEYMEKLINFTLPELKKEKEQNTSFLLKSISEDEEKNLKEILCGFNEFDNNMKSNEETEKLISDTDSLDNFTIKRNKSLIKKSLALNFNQSSMNNTFNHNKLNKEPRQAKTMRSSLNTMSLKKMPMYAPNRNYQLNNNSAIRNLISQQENTNSNEDLTSSMANINIYNPRASLNKNVNMRRSSNFVGTKVQRFHTQMNNIIEKEPPKDIFYVKDKTIDQLLFKKILNDFVWKKEGISRICFRNNTFDFEVLLFINDYFTKSLKRKICVDLKKNKIKRTKRNVETIKSKLIAKNIKIII